ncbi:MAG: hypothetical protein HZB25_08675 [Candidatus Eisenbacteria bacterium]|nr:hypothetical protein [Candidatus Eisenbacteria bacterium]
MNELASRIAKAAGAAAALLGFVTAVYAGARLEQVVLRAVIAFVLAWAACEFLARYVLRTLLLRVLEDRKDRQVDLTVR